MYSVEHYITPDGKDIFQEYLDTLCDKIARRKILRQIDHAMMGNFGDHRNNLLPGISEMRIDVGPGYMVYYTIFQNKMLILLLCAGNKSTQQQDIEKAKNLQNEFIRSIQQ